MRKILIFGGTTEGRLLAEFCSESEIPATVSVTTEYGANLISGLKNINIITGELDKNQITEYIKSNKINLVIDATHPYALEITENLKKSCQECDIKYYRLLREGIKSAGIIVNNISEAVDYLNKNDKSALITTGSKNLSEYIKVKNFRERLAVRVLLGENIFEYCVNLGFDKDKIISGDGIFSLEDNIEHIKKYKSEILVTKESGTAGGYENKVKAAQFCGIEILTIKRPEETGYTLEEIKNILTKKIYIIGTGMDGQKTLTREALECIQKSEVIIGAERMIKTFESLDKIFLKSYNSGEICNFIRKSAYKNYSVLMSGDCGFYSGTEKILKNLKDYDLTVVSGISSPVYFCGKIGKKWENMKFISLHGAENNIIRNIAANEYCFFLLGGETAAKDICRKLCEYGMNNISVYIGDNLGYKSEKVYTGNADNFTELETSKLSVMITENPRYERFVKLGIPDVEFIREKVPMTKAEVRSVIISKLEIENNSICWDIGCGTGSVTVEMAMQCWGGKVYAIDKNPEAVKLTELNAKKFFCDNIETVCGNAPEILENLETPDKIFIGGSCGEIGEILDVIYKKNPYADILVTAVSLETLSKSIEEFEIHGAVTQVMQISVTRTKKIGSHTMFSAENPVFIIKGGEKNLKYFKNSKKFMIAGTNSGCGKTTVTCAILQAMVNRGIKAVSFKCGCDYIDPMFHREVMGIKSYNLDSFFCDDNTLKYLFSENSTEEVSVVEGVMGFYDGIDGKFSSHEISMKLNIPVVIVIDCKGMSTSIGAVMKGFLDYKRPNNIKGFIFNRLSESIADYVKCLCRELNTEFFGYMPICHKAMIESRNLGLAMTEDTDKIHEKINILGEIAEDKIDISKLVRFSDNIDFPEYLPIEIKKIGDNIKIAIARDEAFSFIYESNIDILEKLGCRIEYFSPIHDKKLPDEISGIILSGGYPELYAEKLSQNISMMNDIKSGFKNNMPIIAECGGFMYLHEFIGEYRGVGIISGRVYKTDKLQRFGYINIIAEKDNILCKKGESIPAHEFHYWDSTNCGKDFTALKLSNNKSWECIHAGKNYYMGFPHLYFYSDLKIAENFVNKCKEYENINGKN